jgi:hypothetical protein
MSPKFLTKFLEEYRELPVLWQVHSADYSNRIKRDEAWDLLVQFTREKIPDADTPHSSSIITAAATCLDELILDTEMYEQSWEPGSGVKLAKPDSYVYGHLYTQSRNRSSPI